LISGDYSKKLARHKKINATEAGHPVYTYVQRNVQVRQVIRDKCPARPDEGSTNTREMNEDLRNVAGRTTAWHGKARRRRDLSNTETIDFLARRNLGDALHHAAYDRDNDCVMRLRDSGR